MIRRTLTALLFVLLASCEKGQVLTNDLTDLGINGPVREFSEFHYSVNGTPEAYRIVGFANSTSSNTVSSFNSQGFLTEQNFYDSDSIHDGRVVIVFDGDFKKEKKHFDRKGALIESEKLEYDDVGNLVKRLTYSPDELIVYKYTYKFVNSKKEEECRFDSNDALERRTTFTYDNNGNVTRKIESFSYGQIVYRTEFEFDEDGLMTKEFEFEGDEVANTTTYVYSQSRKPVEIRRFGRDNLLEMESIRKYKDGKIIEDITRDNRGGMFEINNSIRKYDAWENPIEITNYDLGWHSVKAVKEFIYKYDKNGNWTQKLILKDKKATELVIRKFNYY